MLDLKKQIELLVVSFDGEEYGLPKQTYEATCNLIRAVYGQSSVNTFNQYIFRCDHNEDRYSIAYGCSADCLTDLVAARGRDAVEVVDPMYRGAVRGPTKHPALIREETEIQEYPLHPALAIALGNINHQLKEQREGQ